MKLSRHAAKRMQQRHLPPLIIDLLQHYGRIGHQDGATVLYFDEKSRHLAEAELRHALSRFDKLANTYVVKANDTNEVITVGYHFKRIKEK